MADGRPGWRVPLGITVGVSLVVLIVFLIVLSNLSASANQQAARDVPRTRQHTSAGQHRP
jgi:hypothetical protein